LTFAATAVDAFNCLSLFRPGALVNRRLLSLKSTEGFGETVDSFEHSILPLATSDAKALLLTEYIKDKIPLYIEHIKIGDFTPENLDLKSLDTLKENMLALGPNSLEAIQAPLFLFGDEVTASWADFLASLVAVKSTFEQGQHSFDGMIESHDLERTSAWVFGAAIFILGVQSGLPQTKLKSVGQVSSSLVEVPKIPLTIQEKLKLLQNATDAVNSQLKELRIEKASADYEVATLKSELRVVKNQLMLGEMKERHLNTTLKVQQDQFAQETRDLRAQIEQNTEAERELKNAIARMEKDLTDKQLVLVEIKEAGKNDVRAERINAKKLKAEKDKMATELDSFKEQISALREQVDKMKVVTEKELVVNGVDKPQKTLEHKSKSPTKDVELAVNGASASETDNDKPSDPQRSRGLATDIEKSGNAKKTHARKAKTPVTEKETIMYGASSDLATEATIEKPATPEKARGRKQKATTTAVKSNIMLIDLSNAFFADIAEPVHPVSNPPTAKKPVSTPRAKKKTIRKNAGSRNQSNQDAADWSHLSVSTLKRKTIKDLTSYLAVKGKVTEGPDGKALRKDALVELVLK